MTDSSNEDRKKIEEISKTIVNDERKIGSMSRFGYFSIPYSTYIGDRYYSKERDRIYRTEDRKVITEKRGIFTSPSKKGKGPEAFFQNLIAEEPVTLNRVKEDVQKEREEYMNIVKMRKEKSNASPKFRPGGPQEYVDYFDQHKVHYEIPITQPVDRDTRIDGRKVIIEKRGIYTSPAKEGNSTTPGILFSFPIGDRKSYKSPRKIESSLKSPKSNAGEKKQYKKPFMPASLQKCDYFCPDQLVYGYGDEKNQKFDDLLKEAIEERHKPDSKYIRPVPQGAAEHAKPFSPPKLESTGKENLFSPIYGIPFTAHEKHVIPVKEKKEQAQKNIKVQFT